MVQGDVYEYIDIYLSRREHRRVSPEAASHEKTTPSTKKIGPQSQAKCFFYTVSLPPLYVRPVPIWGWGAQNIMGIVKAMDMDVDMDVVKDYSRGVVSMAH